MLALPVLGCAGQPALVGMAAGRLGASVSMGDRRERVTRVAGPLLDGWGKPGIVLCVLNSDLPSAYAWHDGHVFVTRGLVDLLDDQELRAAIAHELGHLVNGAGGKAVVSLGGGSAEVEAGADAAGVKLLEARGLDAGAMTSMLQKVAGSELLSRECRGAIGKRIALLNR